jgi:transposase
MSLRSVRGHVSKPWVVDDALWNRIEPLVPPWPDSAPGPRPLPDRRCLEGILFVLYTGIGGWTCPKSSASAPA